MRTARKLARAAAAKEREIARRPSTLRKTAAALAWQEALERQKAQIEKKKK